MNLSKLSFLILGKGVTYNNCKIFFDKNSITYQAINTEDILNIDNDSILTKNGKINIRSINYIVISPGIKKQNKYVKKLLDAGYEFITDVELLQSQLKAKYICVTGTNGKTSTVNLLADILNNNNQRALACGNNGVSLFKALEEDFSYIIIELSSYQLEYIKNLDSFISIILNISEDHLDRHDSLKEYLDIKLQIFNNADNCIINSDIAVSKKYQTYNINKNKFLINGKILKEISFMDYKSVKLNKKIFKTNGKHEVMNLCACLAILKIIGLSINDTLIGFSQRLALPHRLENFCTYKATKFINDSKSTNASSTLNALESISRSVTLIMGGDKKKISYSLLSKIINDKVKLLILFGCNKKDLYNEILPNVETIFLNNLEEVVSYIFSNFRKKTTILFSPGTSSFSLYQNFEERGNHFKNLVNYYVNKKV
jgi:UDP-N-acetylmuramoylalanine--D-glutamate ligase